MYRSGAIAIDMDAVAREDEGGSVVLEEDWVVVGRLAPVGDVGAERPRAAPFNCLGSR